MTEAPLATELGALLATDLDLDIGVTGFSIPEVDTLLATVAPEESGDPADDALPDAAAARVHRGEVWQLGAHRLICGDVRDPAVLPALMAGGCLRRSLLIRPPLVVRTSMRAAATRPRQCRRSPQTRAE